MEEQKAQEPVSQSVDLDPETQQFLERLAAQPELFSPTESSENPSESPPQETPTEGVQELDFGGRKVKAVDPALKGLHEDWRHQTRKIQEQQRLIRELEQKLAQASSVSSPLTEEEEPEESSSEIYEQFIENPQKFLNKYLNQALKPVVEKLGNLEREKQLYQEYVKFRAKYPDHSLEAMEKVLSVYPQLNNAPFEVIHLTAKGMFAPDPENLLADPKIREKVLADPVITTEAVKRHIASLREKAKQTPTLIGNQPGGAVPTTPPDRPTSFKDALRAWDRTRGTPT